MPFVPGSYTAKAAKIASKGAKAVRSAKVAKATSKGGKVLKAVSNATDETIHTVRGRAKHTAIQAKAKAKGWKAVESTAEDKLTGKKVRVDLLTPSGNPVSIKPDTPKWRKYGKKDLEKYERAFGKKGRVIYYKP